MSELVLNAPLVSCCGSTRGACRCRGTAVPDPDRKVAMSTANISDLTCLENVNVQALTANANGRHAGDDGRPIAPLVTNDVLAHNADQHDVSPSLLTNATPDNEPLLPTWLNG